MTKKKKLSANNPVINDSNRDFYVAFGARIKALRIEKGMSQKDLGDALGVSHSQVQKYEDGIDRMAIDRVVKVIVILGVGLEGLLPGDGQQEVAGAQSIAQGRMAKRLNAAFWAIEDRGVQKAVVEYVEKLSALHHERP